jgi:hypothetical protein
MNPSELAWIEYQMRQLTERAESVSHQLTQARLSLIELVVRTADVVQEANARFRESR